jgi:hypothetical protein
MMSVVRAFGSLSYLTYVYVLVCLRLCSERASTHSPPPLAHLLHPPRVKHIYELQPFKDAYRWTACSHPRQ